MEFFEFDEGFLSAKSVAVNGKAGYIQGIGDWRCGVGSCRSANTQLKAEPAAVKLETSKKGFTKK